MAFVYRTNTLALPPAQYVEIDVAVDRPPGTEHGVAVHGVRIQVVDSHTGKVLPTEQVYRSYVALYATHPVATSADREPVHASRTLVVIGCEARDSIRLPPGYFIPSSGNETWYLRSRLYNSWGQLSGAQRGVLFSLNVTYLPLSSALAQSMLEVDYCILGTANITNASKPNGFDLPTENADEHPTVEWAYDVAWNRPYPVQVILAYGYTQIGALQSKLLLQANQEPLVLQVIYDKSGLISDIDRQYPAHLIIQPNATLQIRTLFSNQAFGRAVFYWQLFLHPLSPNKLDK